MLGDTPRLEKTFYYIAINVYVTMPPAGFEPTEAQVATIDLFFPCEYCQLIDQIPNNDQIIIRLGLI